MADGRPGRRGVDELWVRWAFHHFANNPKATYRKLEEEAEKAAVEMGRDDPPSERTLRRLRRRWETLQAHERAQYGYVHWPETFEAGLLPWEASRAILDLIALYQDKGWGRPTVRMAKWYWRLASVLPDTPNEDRRPAREQMARILAAIEASSKPRHDKLRQIERYLAYALQPGGPKSFELAFEMGDIAAIAEIFHRRVPAEEEGHEHEA